MLDDGAGRAVGYCIGTADTATFAERWRTEFLAALNSAEFPRPEVKTGDPAMEREETRGFRHALWSAECSALQAWPKVLGRFPAHMHIDILPEFQRKGWGTVLIGALFEKVRGMGASGIHLDMVRWNEAGRRFYERIGFRPCGLVLDEGKSGEVGINDVVLTMVKEL